ncbi:MAG: thiol peroxidase [Verrucomicrobia bacterium]|nr:thiol peroxidase [Verrucomicrobiota bacterium]
MTERTGAVTMKGNPITLVGSEVKVGDKAPDFVVVDNALNPVGLPAYRGKVIVISAVLSLDTGLCDTQTRHFNDEATKLGDDVVVLTISMDLPFAQKRWCGAAGVDRVVTLSDYQQASFGQAYGILIKGLRLLTRSVFVIDKGGTVRYVQLVPDTSNEPDYAMALDAVRKLI